MYLADIGVWHVVHPEALVADSLLGVALGVDVDIAFGRVQDVSHVDAQQVGDVLHSFARTWKKRAKM